MCAASDSDDGKGTIMSDQYSTTGGMPPLESEEQLRDRALKRLQDKRGLQAHVVAYVTVNLLIVAIWAVSGGGFFWPMFPLLGWGIGLAFNIWAVVSPEPGPDAVRAEMERLRRRQG